MRIQIGLRLSKSVKRIVIPACISLIRQILEEVNIDLFLEQNYVDNIRYILSLLDPETVPQTFGHRVRKNKPTAPQVTCLTEKTAKTTPY